MANIESTTSFSLEQQPVAMVVQRAELGVLDVLFLNAPQEFSASLNEVMQNSIPVMAFQYMCTIETNVRSQQTEQILANLMGMIPLYSEDADLYRYRSECDCKSFCRRCSAFFRINKRNNTRANMMVTSADIEPFDDQIVDDEMHPVRPTTDILPVLWKADARMMGSLTSDQDTLFNQEFPQSILRLQPGEYFHVMLIACKNNNTYHAHWKAVADLGPAAYNIPRGRGYDPAKNVAFQLSTLVDQKFYHVESVGSIRLLTLLAYGLKYVYLHPDNQKRNEVLYCAALFYEQLKCIAGGVELLHRPLTEHKQHFETVYHTTSRSDPLHEDEDLDFEFGEPDYAPKSPSVTPTSNPVSPVWDPTSPVYNPFGSTVYNPYPLGSVLPPPSPPPLRFRDEDYEDQVDFDES